MLGLEQAPTSGRSGELASKNCVWPSYWLRPKTLTAVKFLRRRGGACTSSCLEHELEAIYCQKLGRLSGQTVAAGQAYNEPGAGGAAFMAIALLTAGFAPPHSSLAQPKCSADVVCKRAALRTETTSGPLLHSGHITQMGLHRRPSLHRHVTPQQHMRCAEPSMLSLCQCADALAKHLC